jgi:hypothetical protein
MKSLIQYGSILVLVTLHHGISALVGHTVSIPEAIFGGAFFGVIGVMLGVLYEDRKT